MLSKSTSTASFVGGLYARYAAFNGDAVSDDCLELLFDSERVGAFRAQPTRGDPRALQAFERKLGLLLLDKSLEGDASAIVGVVHRMVWQGLCIVWRGCRLCWRLVKREACVRVTTRTGLLARNQ